MTPKPQQPRLSAARAALEIESQLQNLWHMHAIGAVVTAPALTLLLWRHARPDRLVAWTLLATTLSLLMALVYYRRAAMPPPAKRTAVDAMSALTALSGAGIGSIVFFDIDSLRDPAYAYGVAACLVAFCAGSFVNLSPRAVLIRLTIFPALVPAAIMMAYAGQWRASLCLLTFTGIVGLQPLTAMRANFESLLRLSDESRWDAEHDPLTGLLNRTGLARRSKDARAVVFIDLDGFKPINDVYGHAAGDFVLCKVAERLIRAIPEGEGFVGRHGGDEFILVLCSPDPSRVTALAEASVARVAEPFAVDAAPQVSVQLTASMGIAWIDERIGLQAALGAADAAMYRAKLARPGSIRWADDPRRGEHTGLVLESEELAISPAEAIAPAEPQQQTR